MSNLCGRTAPPPSKKMKLSHEALSISQLTDEVAAMLHREGKYSIDYDGYGKSIPNAPHVLSTPQPRRQNDSLRLSSPVSVVEDVSSYFDTDTRRKVCDWMYRVSRCTLQILTTLKFTSSVTNQSLHNVMFCNTHCHAKNTHRLSTTIR